MTEEDRKGIAQECRKSIMSALRDVDDIKILERIYISVLVAKNNHCDIAIRGRNEDEKMVCNADDKAARKDDSQGFTHLPEEYAQMV